MSTPARRMNSASAKWPAEPSPEVANDSTPGLALACSISWRAVSGPSRPVTSRSGPAASSEIGWKSPTGSNGSARNTKRLSTWIEALTSSVWPSGGACATNSLPMLPEAPARFSTTTFCPSRAPSAGASTRATVSTAPPGACGTMIRTARVGYGWAFAGAGETATSALIRAPRTATTRRTWRLYPIARRQQTERIVALDRLQLGRVEHAALAQTLHVLLGGAERIVGAVHDLRQRHELLEAEHRRRLKALRHVVVELLHLVHQAVRQGLGGPRVLGLED